MTNKEAIMRIKEHISIHQICEPRAIKLSEALNMAITALQAQETCEDTISRQAAIDVLIGDEPPEVNYGFYFAEKIKELPSVRNDIMISKEDLLEALNSVNLPVDDAVNKIFEVIQDMPSAQPLSEADLTELEGRFGKYVRFVVEDMISGKEERWKT